MATEEKDTNGIDLDELQKEAEMLVYHLKARQPRLPSWNQLVTMRMENLYKLISKVLGK